MTMGHAPHPPLDSYAEVRNFLFGLRNTGKTYGIERMERLAALIDHPERSYPVIHVAGTNGKGSTCAMLEALCREMGLRTGLYTSPHLIRLNERIQVDRQFIPNEAIVEKIRTLTTVAETLKEEDPDLYPSFFEFMTAAAFLHFAQKEVDVALIEVGLGGRLDATNVVHPAVTAITSIGLDHTQILGDTVEKIAAEKAGIIKPGIPVFLGNIDLGPRKVIETIAQERGAPVYYAADFPARDTNLQGSYQADNARLAAGIVSHLYPELVKPEAMDKALNQIQWKGRWHETRLKDGTHLIIDATHNAEGARGLEENLKNLACSKLTVVVGILGVDRAAVILDILSRYSKELIWVVPNQPRASSWEEVSHLWESSIPVRQLRIDDIFFKNRCNLGPALAATVLVTGSLYLLGEVYALIEGQSDTSDESLQDDVARLRN